MRRWAVSLLSVDLLRDGVELLAISRLNRFSLLLFLLRLLFHLFPLEVLSHYHSLFSALFAALSLVLLLELSDFLTSPLNLSFLFISFVPSALLLLKLLLELFEVLLPGRGLFHLLNQEMMPFSTFDIVD